MRDKTIVMFGAGITERGGAARRTLLLAEGLASRGWRIRMITRAGTLNRVKLIRTDGITALEVPGLRLQRFGAILFGLTALPMGVIWGRKARAFIAIQLTSQSIVAAFCSFLLRRPYLTFLTTGGSISELDYIERSRLARARKALLSRATYVIAQTANAAADIRRLLPSASVAILPNPVKLHRPSPLNGQPRASFAGRLSTEKDLGTLLEAWKRIASSDPESSLVIIGEGGNYRSEEARIRALVAADDDLSRSVTFTGWLPDASAMIRTCDVFVLPSISEGMSNALLEACSLGRVVVASRIPSNVQVLGDDYPLLFDPSDPDGLAERLRAAFEDGEVRRTAVAAVANVAKRSSVAAIAESLENMIEHAAARSRN